MLRLHVAVWNFKCSSDIDRSFQINKKKTILLKASLNNPSMTDSGINHRSSKVCMPEHFER